MIFLKQFSKDRYWGLRPWTRHSHVLVGAGVGYIAIGATYAVSEPSVERMATLEVALRWMSLGGWGIVFIIVGSLAILSSRWPPFADSWGYMALTGLSAGWGATYLLGVVLTGAPIINITSGIIWSLVAFMWWGISGLVNPDQVSVAVVNGSS